MKGLAAGAARPEVNKQSARKRSQGPCRRLKGIRQSWATAVSLVIVTNLTEFLQADPALLAVLQRRAFIEKGVRAHPRVPFAPYATRLGRMSSTGVCHPEA